MELFKIAAIQDESVKVISKNKEIDVDIIDIIVDEVSKQRINRNDIKIGDYLKVNFFQEEDIDFGFYIPREFVENNQDNPPQDSSQRRSKTEPPQVPSSPKLQLGPIGLERQLLKDLLFSESILKALESKFYSYRFSRLDINSFYRAAGIAVLEYIASEIATRGFKEKVYNSLLDARIYLSNYWGDVNESWLTMMGMFVDYDNSVGTAEKLKFLEDEIYISTAYTYESGMILMIKFLEALWVLNNGANGDHLWFFESQSREQVIMDIIGAQSQPGENDILFFSLSVDAEINIIKIDPSQRIIKNTYNEGKENVLNFIEINETFYPIFSYEQIYYESNPLGKSALEPFRGLNGGRWPIEVTREKAKARENDDAKKSEALKDILDLLLKEKELSHYPWQTLGKVKEYMSSLEMFSPSDTELLDKIIEEKQCQYCCVLKDLITLKCKNQVCKEDLLNSVCQDTNKLIVINNWEKENQNELIAKCPVCKDPLDDEDIELIVGSELFQQKKKESLDREKIQNPPKSQCKCCLEEKLENLFYQDEEVNCIHVCWECMIENVRRNNLECVECHIKYTDLYLAKIKQWEYPCFYCKENKNLVREFSGKLCTNHKICCLSCLQLFQEYGSCLACNSDKFDNAQMEKLKQILEKECKQCGKPYSRFENLENKNCFCNVCENCQCESIESCLICRKEFEDGIKNLLRRVKNEKDDEERRRRLRMRQCGICQETRNITDMRGLDCNHYFCENCLKEMLTYYIENRMLDKAIRCPHDECGSEIRAQFLEDLLSKELWNKLNLFLIDQDLKLVSCPSCHNKFEAPISRKAICLFCKCEFCKTCSDIWHDKDNCEEIYIERRIKEMEDNGEIVSQCPGCKQPYTKDDKCEHVTCMNPKCKTVFCFTCSCLRSPTMAHGNHFHRPECKWFAPLPAVEKDRFLPNHCDECKRLGELCKPPMALAVPRKFAAGEI